MSITRTFHPFVCYIGTYPSTIHHNNNLLHINQNNNVPFSKEEKELLSQWTHFTGRSNQNQTQ